ncbi:MAG: VOC family protein [Leptolyngbyaceae cyanobacterium]
MESFLFKEAFVTLATYQLDITMAFYKGLLGSDPQIYLPDIYAEFLLPGLKLGIFQPKPENDCEFVAHNHGMLSLCFEVENLEAAIAHLTALGYAPPGQPITASHGREVYAYDPDGNRLILHQAI